MAKTHAAPGLRKIIDAAAAGHAPEAAAALQLEHAQSAQLLAGSEELTLRGHGRIVTYSRKVFIPLTQLCRDVCHYCTFAKAPRALSAPYMSIAEVLAVARAGAAAGCKEALFTLGDKPELRYAAARGALAAMGFASTLEYLEHAAGEVYRETGLLPHLNPGLMDAAGVRPPAPGVGVDGHHARERQRAAHRARRPALWLPGQAARGAPGDARRRRRGGRALHHRAPHRHR